MLLNEFKNINEMAAASPWTTFVRGLIINDPNITDAAINALVAQQGITPPNFLKVRIDGLRASIAKQAAKHGGVAPPPKPAKTKAPGTTPTPNTPKTPSATPTPAPTLAGNDQAHIQKITDWLNSHDVSNFTVDPETYVVDVDGDVHLDKFFHTKLPIKFGKVNGDFYIAATGVTSLHGCPDFVDGRFACQNNKGLKSAVGSPSVVMGSVDFENCPISNFEGFPREIHGDLDITGTKITSFSGINKIVKTIDGNIILGKTGSKITDSIMGLILVRKLQEVKIDWDSQQTSAGSAFGILNTHLKSGRSGPDCQIEMQDAGLAKFAKM